MIIQYDVLSDIIDIIGNVENTNEVNMIANSLIDAVNQIRNSELHTREHTSDNFKEVIIRNVKGE